MIQFFRFIFSPEVLITLHASLKRFLFFSGLGLLALSLFLVNKYIDQTFLLNVAVNNISSPTEEEVSEETINIVEIKKGDTLGGVLKRQNLPNKDINDILSIAKAQKAISGLKVGQNITFEYNLSLIDDEQSDLSSEQRTLNKMSISVDKAKTIDFIRRGSGFVTNYAPPALTKVYGKYEATVDSNVISSLKKIGLSTNSIVQLINAYTHQIDFQRQIKSGDKITVITEKFVTPDQKLSHHGKLIHASIKTKGQEYNIYRYSPTNNEKDSQFYSEEGKSIKGQLLKTPVKVVRISSHYGYRSKHPLLGYGKMHKGVDFAAPSGTPIYAAGSGTVKFIGWKSGYGRFIVIDHNGKLSTAYAHASRFAKNLQKGSKVKQGEVIAFVGQTGRASGAHLHYEIRVNDKQVNPLTYKSIPGIELAGEKLKKFNKFKESLVGLQKKLNKGIAVAVN